MQELVLPYAQLEQEQLDEVYLKLGLSDVGQVQEQLVLLVLEQELDLRLEILQ
jgi:hypothetical protein